MNCGNCGIELDPEDVYQRSGMDLCEDCYIDAASALKACDPWAAHIAKSRLVSGDGGPVLSDAQQSILTSLKEEEGIEPEVLAERVGMEVSELEREFATLRHMEKVRGALRDGKKVLLLW